MTVIRCNKCKSVVATLGMGSEWQKGTIAVCDKCYSKHIKKHKDKKSSKNK